MKKLSIILIVVGVVLIVFSLMHAIIMNFMLFDSEITMLVMSLGVGLIFGSLRAKAHS